MSNREQNEGHRQDKSQVAATLRIAVDIGGTFTDLAAFDERGDTLSFGKALSTHDDLVRGIQDTVNGACVNFKDAFLFLHGSTIVINTLLERTGARLRFENEGLEGHARVRIVWPRQAIEVA